MVGIYRLSNRPLHWGSLAQLGDSSCSGINLLLQEVSKPEFKRSLFCDVLGWSCPNHHQQFNHSWSPKSCRLHGNLDGQFHGITLWFWNCVFCLTFYKCPGTGISNFHQTGNGSLKYHFTFPNLYSNWLWELHLDRGTVQSGPHYQ